MYVEVLVEMAIPGRRHKKPVTLVARVGGSFCHMPFDTYLIFFLCEYITFKVQKLKAVIQKKI